ncbi:MAG: ribosome maturation factor RimP [Nitrospirae bacterium]|nr:ribosome maturation factor RimP [Nitrospirota bacterium]
MEIGEKLKKLAEEATLGLGVRIVKVELKGKGRRMMLRVTIDKDPGVTLDDCASVSRQLSAVLDVEDIIQGTYNLEVTSPGIDRPLESRDDFLKNLGKLVRVVTKEKIGKQSYFLGRLSGVQENFITIVEAGKTVEACKTVEIPLDKVSRANVEIEIK